MLGGGGGGGGKRGTLGDAVAGVYTRFDARKRFDENRQVFDVLNKMKSDKIEALEARLARYNLADPGAWGL